MARAAERAYGSVREPAEGTILTVVREMAARVASEIAHMDEPRLHHRVDDDAQNAMIAEVLEAALRSGELSVARGPELLPILREAGVVDAGGYGLTVMFAGVIAALRGTARARARPPRAGADHAPAARVDDVPLLHELRGHRRGARPGELERPAGAARRLGAGRRRQPHAEGAPPHRRARARDRAVRRDRRGLAPRRRRHDASRSPSARERLAEAIETLRRARRRRRARGWASCSRASAPWRWTAAAR